MPYDRGAQLVGLCLGAFALADAGLLDGGAATTHWQGAETFRRRFPDVDLRPETLYVDEASIITGAGATAGVDTCLHVLAQRAGFDALAGSASARRPGCGPTSPPRSG